KRGQEEADLPDLLVIDGGKGQLASALAAAKDLGVDEVDIISLAKSRDLEVHDRDEESAQSPERVFLPQRKDPIVLRQNSAELYLLTRLRDEAHRFAITFQQKSMRRGNFRSALDDIPGVGATRKKLLLRHFGSLKRVRESGIEELAEVLGPTVAERVHAALHGHQDEDEADPIREASLADADDLINEKSEEGSPPGSP
ncbi:MAG TPA: helix-hairpin-helix domain-containing protein, partial [Cystobacter sp.]